MATGVTTARPQWIVVLLGLAVMLTYVDRGAIAIAAPLMKDELHLSASGFGLAVSAFFWAYAPLNVVTGWLCDRFCVYRLLAGGLALWALSTALTGLAGGLVVLVLLRLLLGLGESIVFPGSSKIIAAQVSEDGRGLANALPAAGIAFGPAVGTLAGGLILLSFGWRAVFLVFGGVTLLWLIPWASASKPLRSAVLTAPVVDPFPVGRLLRTPALWAMGIGHFFNNYGFYFLVSWLPLYLVKTRGFTIGEMTAVTTFGFALQGVVALVGGRWSDGLVRGGVDEGRLRRRLLAFAQLCGAASVAGIFVSQSLGALALWLAVAGVAAGIGATNLYALAQQFAGPRAAGSWVGVQNALGNMSGIVGPIVTGLIVDKLGGYGWAFAAAVGCSLLGAAWWLVVVPEARCVDPAADPRLAAA